MSEPAQTAGWQKAPPLSIIQAVKRVFQKTFVFSGRARPAEFWKFALFCIVISILLVVVWATVFGPEIHMKQVTADDGTVKNVVIYKEYNGGLLGNIFGLICLIPSISVAVRRLHDTNHRGWWILLPLMMTLTTVIGAAIAVIGLSPIIEALSSGTTVQVKTNDSGPVFGIIAAMLLTFAAHIYLLILLIGRGTPGTNRFGPNPIEIAK